MQKFAAQLGDTPIDTATDLVVPEGILADANMYIYIRPLPVVEDMADGHMEVVESEDEHGMSPEDADELADDDESSAIEPGSDGDILE